MKHFISHILVSLCLLLVSFGATSQVNVRATVDKDKILIGEPITLTLQAYTPLGEPVGWFNLDTLPGFEFIRKGKLDTIENVDNKKLEQTLIITSFDSGRVALQPLQLTVGSRTYFTDSVFVDVSYKDFDPAADYKDIKSIEEVEDKTQTWLPWILGAVTLLALAIIVWLLKRKKPVKDVTVKEAPRLPPYEEAIAALEKIHNEELPDQLATKNYYTNLNDILRVFLQRRMQISSLEKTNDELIIQLRQTDLNKERFSSLAQAMRMSDFVKFAKYQPGAAENEENWEIVRDSIRVLNNLAGEQETTINTQQKRN